MTGALCRCILRSKNKTSLSSVPSCGLIHVFCHNTDQPTDVWSWLRAVQRFRDIYLRPTNCSLTWFEPCVCFRRAIAINLTDVLPQHRVTVENRKSCYFVSYYVQCYYTTLSVSESGSSYEIQL